MFQLSNQQINQFYQKGFLTVHNIFTSKEIADMNLAFDNLEAILKGLDKTEIILGAKFQPSESHQRVSWAGAAEPKLIKYSKKPKLISLVRQILEVKETEPIYQLVNQAHPRFPEEGPFAFHYDALHRKVGRGGFIDVSGKGSCVQVLIAIDEFRRDNGVFKAIPLDILSNWGVPYDPSHDYNQSDMETFDKLDKLAFPVLLKPGDVFLFGMYTFHGSLANNSSRTRRGMINCYSLPGANLREYHGAGLGVEIRS
jgi:ectoine hydroxylase-related dioxygenase (phytanoyl-CoA dioxygenase family)